MQLSHLLNDHKLRKEMGKNSRSLLLQEFSVESAVTNILIQSNVLKNEVAFDRFNRIFG